jgi:hypothetical protein
MPDNPTGRTMLIRRGGKTIRRTITAISHSPDGKTQFDVVDEDEDADDTPAVAPKPSGAFAAALGLSDTEPRRG